MKISKTQVTILIAVVGLILLYFVFFKSKDEDNKESNYLEFGKLRLAGGCGAGQTSCSCSWSLSGPYDCTPNNYGGSCCSRAADGSLKWEKNKGTQV